MKRITFILAFLMFFSTPKAFAERTFFQLKAETIMGEMQYFSQYAGKVILVVNTASRCGFTPQYAGLERLQEQYKEQGFVVLGFPSNDFLSQEPGSNDEIKKFCEGTYRVSFPLFSKNPVTGEQKQDVYKFLTDESGYSGVLWNFEKFLVGRDGKVIDRFRSTTSPESSSITEKIEEALKVKP